MYVLRVGVQRTRVHVRYKPADLAPTLAHPTKPICLLITGAHTCQFIRRQKTTRERACTWQWKSRKPRFHAINEHWRRHRRRRRGRHGLIRLYDVLFVHPISSSSFAFSSFLSFAFLSLSVRCHPLVTGICFNFSTPLCPSPFLLPKHPFRPRIPTASSRIEILQKEHIKRRMPKSVRCANYFPDDCRFLSTLFVFPFRATLPFSQYYCPRAPLPSNYRKAAPHRCVS